jgi:hypothetical protein
MANLEYMKLYKGKLSILLVLLGSVHLSSCKEDQYNAEYYAKRYCNCISEQKSQGRDFLYSRTKCDALLVSENHFFAIDFMDLTYGRYTNFIPQSLGDSVAVFHNKFYGYVEKNCCELAVWGCDNQHLSDKI